MGAPLIGRFRNVLGAMLPGSLMPFGELVASHSDGGIIMADANGAPKFYALVDNDQWPEFATVFSANSGSLTATAHMHVKALGKTVWVRARANIADNGNGAGANRFTLPYVARNVDTYASFWGSEDSQTGLGIKGKVYPGTNVLEVTDTNNGYPARTNGIIYVSGVYERA